jgi:hypothetical protein
MNYLQQQQQQQLCNLNQPSLDSNYSINNQQNHFYGQQQHQPLYNSIYQPQQLNYNNWNQHSFVNQQSNHFMPYNQQPVEYNSQFNNNPFVQQPPETLNEQANLLPENLKSSKEIFIN